MHEVGCSVDGVADECWCVVEFAGAGDVAFFPHEGYVREVPLESLGYVLFYRPVGCGYEVHGWLGIGLLAGRSWWFYCSFFWDALVGFGEDVGKCVLGG